MVLESRNSCETIQLMLVSPTPTMSMTISVAICSTLTKGLGTFLSPPLKL
ncbi:hypothetical protein TIFTF001_040637 [Ficus carica]|uniref:Uncharacterized protein n=1 Tax=Ficus carica TaxID=3494 RepID=A0AA87ZI61_FICCA|nr:hypothetical protein TIFTF001_040637 [Ficus carica]